MATISDADFLAILGAHGVTTTLKIKDDTQGSPTQSLFDTIYGSMLNQATGYIDRPMFCLFQYITGEEQWVGAIGDLAVGDVMVFAKSSYTDSGATYAPVVDNKIVYAGKTYVITQVIPNQTAGDVIFLEIHAKYSSGV